MFFFFRNIHTKNHILRGGGANETVWINTLTKTVLTTQYKCFEKMFVMYFT